MRLVMIGFEMKQSKERVEGSCVEARGYRFEVEITEE
jgi:hypothetical protein